MNIEVDVAAQLFPNPFTMAFTLLVTGVLFFCIYKLVWDPARKIIAKRQAYYDEQVSGADMLNEQAKANLDRSKEAIYEADELAQKIKEDAKKEAKLYKEDVMASAHKQADELVDKAKERMDKERRELLADINEQIVDVALAASEKLISSKDVASQDKEAIERFIKEYEDGSDR